MSKKDHEKELSRPTPEISKKAYKISLHKLQIELVKLQRHFIQCDDKFLKYYLNIIKDLLSRLHYAEKDERPIIPNPQLVFAYAAAYLEGDQLAK